MADEQYYLYLFTAFISILGGMLFFFFMGGSLYKGLSRLVKNKDKDFNQKRTEKYHYDLGYSKAQADAKKSRLDFERTLALMHVGYPVIGISNHRAHPVVGVLKRVLTRDQSSPFAIHPGLMIQDYVTGEEIEFYGATYIFNLERLMAVCRLSPVQRASLWSTGLVVEYDRLNVDEKVTEQWIHAGLHYPQINEILTKAGFYNLAHFQTQEETQGI